MEKRDISGIKLLADFVFLSKYSQRKNNGELENWEETIDRIYDMHIVKLLRLQLATPSVLEKINEAKDYEKARKILSSQRGRQFASANSQSGILKHEAKMYNCCSTFVDRIDVFGEIMYLLLCGCGVGYSLHREYVEKLPEVSVKRECNSDFNTFVIEDSIEGWADSIKELMRNVFEGDVQLHSYHFNYSNIRPQGALIDGKFVAPGHEPLKKCHENIIRITKEAQGRKLTTLEIHDIICHIADSVISGGVRRSAMIALFDKDDNLMLTAKTGNWWNDNPQRAMANNSILTTDSDSLSYIELKEKLQIIRQFGEPALVKVKNYRFTTNPCGEIIMEPIFDGLFSGFAFCNLVEINAEEMENEEDFYVACRVASFIATVQSLYTDFKYLSSASKKIAERDRAIGVSITGVYGNRLLRKEVLKEGARIVSETNALWAAIFCINKSRACTTIKPSGNASSILGLYCSGIHPAHARQYIRRVRIKTQSPEYNALRHTPLVKILRDDEAVLSFPIHSSNPDLVFKDEITAVEHLKFIGMVKHHWINKGGLDENYTPNNISATVEVRDDEWDEVAAVLFANDHLFTGISLLPKLGDQIYDNAPFQRLSTPELENEYNLIKEYIENNDIDFNKIMSERDDVYSGDLVAVGCNGGACELIK